MKVWKEKFGKAVLVCSRCKNLATGGYESIEAGYTEMECVVFSCHNHGCGNRNWAWCSTCKERFSKGNVASHVTTRKHKSNFSKIGVANAIVLNQTDQAILRETSSEAMLHFVSRQEDVNTTNAGSVGTYEYPDDGGSLANLSPGAFKVGMDAAMVVIEQGENSQEAESPKVVLFPPYPRISMKGNEWLAKAFLETPKATLEELSEVFIGDGWERMLNFCVAEHATMESQPGHCGGGLQLLAAQAFQNSVASAIDKGQIPDFAEALWHFQYVVLNNSLSDKQRQRLGAVLGPLQQHSGNVLKHTNIPSYKEQSRIYGKTGKQSFWNNLPIPPVECIGGVAYTSPEHIVKFMFALGIPVDNIFVQVHENKEAKSSPDRVEYVEDCRRFRDWIKLIPEKLEDGDGEAPLERCLA
jgi:hypothetical protein